MDDIITAIEEILTAETGSGGDLEDFSITKEENEIPKDAVKVVVISPVDEEFIENVKASYEIVKGSLFLTVMVKVDKSVVNRYQAASKSARQEAAAVRKVVYASPTLVSTTFPNGLVCDDNYTRITRQLYGYGAEDGVWYAWARLSFSTKYIYRNGIITLQ